MGVFSLAQRMRQMTLGLFLPLLLTLVALTEIPLFIQ